VSELAVAERVRPQSMAQTVGDLEGDGFVTRRPDPDDRRRSVVELTDQGRAVLEADRAQREGWLARAIADELAPSEVELIESAVEILRRLAES
jgi:DNA-binding MarR family transcriptional regulator